MHKILLAGIAALAFGVADMAIAAESADVRSPSPGPISSQSIRDDLESMGYRVIRIASEHGIYKVRATDGETGTPLKLTYDVATGRLISAKHHH